MQMFSGLGASSETSIDVRMVLNDLCDYKMRIENESLFDRPEYIPYCGIHTHILF